MWEERAEEKGKKGKKREGEEKKEGGEERFLFLDSDRRTVENNVPRITRATLTNIVEYLEKGKVS